MNTMIPIKSERKWTAITVDSHPAIQFTLKTVLQNVHIELLAQTGSGREAVNLIKRHRPSFVVLDVNLTDLDGISVMKRVSELRIKTQFLVITSYGTSPDIIKRCQQAGASGVLDKSQSLDDIALALQALKKGLTCYSSHIANTFMSGGAEIFSRLSHQEFVVFKKIVNGLKNKDIALDLMLSPKTISTYKTRILKKLNAESDYDLIRLADAVGFEHSEATHRLNDEGLLKK